MHSTWSAVRSRTPLSCCATPVGALPSPHPNAHVSSSDNSAAPNPDQISPVARQTRNRPRIVACRPSFFCFCLNLRSSNRYPKLRLFRPVDMPSAPPSPAFPHSNRPKAPSIVGRRCSPRPRRSPAARPARHPRLVNSTALSLPPLGKSTSSSTGAGCSARSVADGCVFAKAGVERGAAGASRDSRRVLEA